jgi:hypothetical protein
MLLSRKENTPTVPIGGWLEMICGRRSLTFPWGIPLAESKFFSKERIDGASPGHQCERPEAPLGPLGSRPEPVIGALSSGNSGLSRSNVPSNRTVPAPSTDGLIQRWPANRSSPSRPSRSFGEPNSRVGFRMGSLLGGFPRRSRRPALGEPNTCLLLSRPTTVPVPIPRASSEEIHLRNRSNPVSKYHRPESPALRCRSAEAVRLRTGRAIFRRLFGVAASRLAAWDVTKHRGRRGMRQSKMHKK